MTLVNIAASTRFRARRPLPPTHGWPGNATDKALRAYALVGADIRVTERLAARIESASLTYVSALSCMTEAEREAVRAGTLKLVEYVTKRWRQPAIDVDELVTELGADRVLAALDRLTAPSADGPVAA